MRCQSRLYSFLGLASKPARPVVSYELLAVNCSPGVCVRNIISARRGKWRAQKAWQPANLGVYDIGATRNNLTSLCARRQLPN